VVEGAEIVSVSESEVSDYAEILGVTEEELRADKGVPIVTE